MAPFTAADFRSLFDTVRVPLETETEIDMLVLSEEVVVGGAAAGAGVGAGTEASVFALAAVVSDSIVRSIAAASALAFSFCCCAFACTCDACVGIFCGGGNELNFDGLAAGSNFADLLAGCCGSATSHFEERFRPSPVDA